MLIEIIIPLGNKGTLRKMWFHTVEEDGHNEDKDHTSDSTSEPYPLFQSFDSQFQIWMMNIGMYSFSQI